jgi:hypothetical protein
MLMLKLMPTLPGVTPFTNLNDEKKRGEGEGKEGSAWNV